MSAFHVMSKPTGAICNLDCSYCFFRRALALEQQYRRPGQRVLNTLQTNATLITDEWARFLRDDVGAEFIQFIPVVERTSAAALGDQVSARSVGRSVGRSECGRFLIIFSGEWARYNFCDVFAAMLDAALAHWLGMDNADPPRVTARLRR